jgi:two-component system response regulator AtoC
MTGQRVLVVDDEPKAQRVMEIMLRRMGHEVVCVANGEEALQSVQLAPVDLVITDLNMPEMNGIELLSALRAEGFALPVIVVTAYGTVESAVAAMKQGAFDYLTRPFDVDAVQLVIQRALEMNRIQQENRFLRGEMDKGWGEFIGQSQAMREVYALIEQVGPSKASVFICGETGTGKELVARAIHRASRRTGLFVPINCAAIPADILESELFGHSKGAFTGAHKEHVGKFEMAHGGTLFLDEITELDPALQAKLLRVLQENVIERVGGHRAIAVDIRIVAATNRDPLGAVQEGRLREDLFYRLNVIMITVPPLRERLKDIPLLVDHFIEKHSARSGRAVSRLNPSVLERMQRYPWPGNVRELENVIERAVVLGRGNAIEVEHLPEVIAPANEAETKALFLPATLDLESQVDQLQTQLISEALARSQGNKAQAARLLGVSERTLWYKLKRYNLS